MIDEIRHDREVTDGERLPRLEVVEVERISLPADENLRRVDQTAGETADVDRGAVRQRTHQAEVVLMGMADKKRLHNKARKVHTMTVGIEGKSGIEKNRRLSG